MRFDRETVDGLADDLAEWTTRLAPLAGPETEQTNGRVPSLPVRGHAMVPELRVTSAGGGRVDGTVTFGRWFMGGGMAAHGGAVALLFDEALGILASASAKAITRTALILVGPALAEEHAFPDSALYDPAHPHVLRPRVRS